jgi:hypothetical protein
MAAMVGARRALLAARFSPRGAIAAASAPAPLYGRVDLPLRYCTYDAMLFLVANLFFF